MTTYSIRHIFLVWPGTVSVAKRAATRKGAQTFTWLGPRGEWEHYEKRGSRWFQIDQDTLVGKVAI